MPSPASDNPETLRPAVPGPPRARRWPWIVASLLVAIPLALTLAGIVTSPPRAGRVPAGRIVFMEADEPSEHTTLLRGLRITLPGSGQSHELLRETEPQDVDAGSREWITQPKASPDGRWLAYEKQIITLQEEKHGIVNQLWVLRLDSPRPAPRLLLDVTRAHLKQFVGLAWTPDSRRVVFLNDAFLYSVTTLAWSPDSRRVVSLNDAFLYSVTTAGILTRTPLPFATGLTTQPDLSATRSPALSAGGEAALEMQTRQGDALVLAGQGGAVTSFFRNDRQPVWTLAPDGTLATARPGRVPQLEITSPRTASGKESRIPARWGWSVFGGRRITSLKWSPDGRYLGYSVSKPPFEDELFYADTRTGQCRQLPIRTGRAAWDWTR